MNLLSGDPLAIFLSSPFDNLSMQLPLAQVHHPLQAVQRAALKARPL